MKIINGIEQGSEEWLRLRLGKATASRFSSILSNGVKGKPSKTRQSYLYEIVAEIITGSQQECFVSQAMDWGSNIEPLARQFYSEKTGQSVEQVCFVEHNEHIGCSPDGLVSTNGLVEFKCPKTSTQIERVLSGVFPSEYKPQVQGQLWICQREWCDFVSYDPRIQTDAKYFCIRVERDEEYIKYLDEEVSRFIFEALEMVHKL